MDPALLSTPALLALGLTLLGFLLRWLFGRAERTLDQIARSIAELVQTVGTQATRIAVLEAKVEVLEHEIGQLRGEVRRVG